jgi:hypothetical protein
MQSMRIANEVLPGASKMGRPLYGMLLRSFSLTRWSKVGFVLTCTSIFGPKVI